MGLIAALFGAICAHGADPVVNTTLGPVQGIGPKHLDNSSCFSFYGIPYAAPPVGKARFRPPSHANPWSHVRPAQTVGPSCLQPFFDGFVNLPPVLERIFEKFHLFMEPMEEDCLFLNIFTPSLPSLQSENEHLKPVMVWFHGGGMVGGSGDKQSGVPLYDGRRLCSDGDVIVVTVNYRLGIFGFLTTEELKQQEGTAGNMGFQDQRMALEWVQHNARSFGGDPTRVTIFGESSGGGSVASHIISKRSQGLFRGAIMQSGGLWMNRWSDNVKASYDLAQSAGCPNASLACLRALPALKLLHSVYSSESSVSYGGATADGYEFSENDTPRSILQRGDFSAVPILAGTNLNESAFFACPPPRSAFNETLFRHGLATYLDILPTGDAMNAVVEAYSASKYYGNDWFRAFVDVQTDRDYFCDTRYLLNISARHGAPTYSWRFDHCLGLLSVDRCLGVPHANDLFFLWGNLDFMLESRERALGAQMRQWWSAFAWNLSPTVSAMNWPRYSPGAVQMHINLEQNSHGAHWKEKQCILLDSI